MTPPGILPSPLRDKVGYSNHDRFRGHIPVHCCSGLQPPCLRFAMAVTGHHARLGTRLLARLCRGRHSRRLGYVRFQGATRTEPYGPNSGIRLVWGFSCQPSFSAARPFLPFFAFSIPHSWVRSLGAFVPTTDVSIAVARNGGQGRRALSAAGGLSLTAVSTTGSCDDRVLLD